MLLALLYGLYRALGRAWLEKRIRLALLERAQAAPDHLQAFEEAARVVGKIVNGAKWTQQDYLMTGVLLGVLGVGSGATGLYLHTGRLAVGLYLGGFGCIGMGVLAAMTGLVAGLAARRAKANDRDERV